ncbi:probable WRKY transcription factor 51 [Cynara cardunculus var. scolymus]|uniref:probable WRKY transcription factor 51 n=1 Tax=Cynara cardunculus var. scolymus TaxID=59895 RepID=UPI000D62E703|nr:probable WRKY transcription factor 51 [Cynara cardunculus var. scolymus]
MDASLPPTSLPPSQDLNSSSSSSLNFPFSSFNDDPIYRLFDFDHTLYYIHNPNPNPNPNPPLFIDLPSYQDSSSSSFPAYVSMKEQSSVLLDLTTANNTAESSHISIDDTCMPQPDSFHRDEFNRERVPDETKISFRVKTALEVLDDGYRWRKYGKKKVKSSPNLRNYYKCSSTGCEVKKRVERDKDDSSYLIATYIGMHNHEIPSLIPCNTRPTEVWTLQLS